MTIIYIYIYFFFLSEDYFIINYKKLKDKLYWIILINAVQCPPGHNYKKTTCRINTGIDTYWLSRWIDKEFTFHSWPLFPGFPDFGGPTKVSSTLPLCENNR